MSSHKTVIILLGPTGVGKTGTAILLAQSLKTEIINADSMQIYKHMDIGTAKPTAQERSVVRHHLIDIVEPSDSFSAGKYREAVIPIIEDLHSRGKIPIITGGTGLYIKSLTRGIFSGPSADWALREKLILTEEKKQGSLYDYLLTLDPDAAAKIMRTDIRRIVRAIEVCVKTDQGISELQRSHTRPLPYEFIRIGLTRERKELYRLIEQRVDVMISEGLVDEVKNLLHKHPGKTAMQAIGYKEIAEYLRGPIPLEEAVRLIKKRTRNYAKRQFAWFRKEEGIRWADVTGRYTAAELYHAIALLLKNAVS